MLSAFRFGTQQPTTANVALFKRRHFSKQIVYGHGIV